MAGNCDFIIIYDFFIIGLTMPQETAKKSLTHVLASQGLCTERLNKPCLKLTASDLFPSFERLRITDNKSKHPVMEY